MGRSALFTRQAQSMWTPTHIARLSAHEHAHRHTCDGNIVGEKLHVCVSLATLHVFVVVIGMHTHSHVCIHLHNTHGCTQKHTHLTTRIHIHVYTHLFIHM